VLFDILKDDSWQMSPCERAALKALLGELAPQVAIEIGTAAGGSLRRIAAASDHVHAFDLRAPDPSLAQLTNVTFHVGDSHELLPRVLKNLEEQNTKVDFVLVDGDHSADGVRRDIEDLLRSPVISQALILVHDSSNPEVRAGLDAVNYRDWGPVSWVDLDWLPGYVPRDRAMSGEPWAGLGLIVTRGEAAAEAGPAQIAEYAWPITELMARIGARGLEDGYGSHEIETLRTRVHDLEVAQAVLTNSKSWQITRPLRAARRALRRT
jgi:Methyltransferase domain